MLKKNIYILLLLLCVLNAPAFAQNEQEQAVKQLTNNNSKQWIFDRFETYMGSGEQKCSRGEKWKFSKDGRVTIIKCVDEKIVETERTWTLEVKSKLDVILKIEGVSSYTLLFPPKKRAKEQMTLRIKASKPTEKTKDLKFYYEVD